ncbi:hypothetical protein AURDEDRAFT_153567 [Auricularia subglabra TFB-10046 SS5]|nr:hypothetical protein AURDEDRAFT_153567 [Auricularia subglabra TFB-10046 SS5]
MPSTYAAAIRARQDFVRETMGRLEGRSMALSASLQEATLALEAAQAVVDALRNEREDVDKQHEALASTFATLPPAFDPQIIQRLPTELLRAIFHEVVSRPDRPEWPSSICVDDERTEAPYICASVCRRWRAVATSMPSLWSYIAVDRLDSGLPAKSLFYTERVRQQLDRSKSHPLDIVLEWLDGYPWSLEPQYPRIVAALVCHIARWRRCDFGLPYGITLKQVECLRTPAPLLERFCIASADEDEMLPFSASGTVPTYLPGSPLLRQFSSATIFLTPRKPMLRLTHLDVTMQDQPTSSLWELLQMTPALEDLRINFHGVLSTTPDPPSTTLTLPALRYLSISGDPPIVSSWATVLRLPGLEEMFFYGSNLFDERFRTFCRAVCSGITILTLEDVHLFGVEAIARLPLPTVFPRVRRARFSGHMHLSFLLYLSDPGVWPLLASLTLNDWSLRGETAEALVTLARNRSHEREPNLPELKLTLENSSVAAWLPAQLRVILGDDAVCYNGAWNELEEVEELADTMDDEDDEPDE